MPPDETMLHGACKAKEEGHFSPSQAQGHFWSGSITGTGSLPVWSHRRHRVTSDLDPSQAQGHFQSGPQGKCLGLYWGRSQHQEGICCPTILFLESSVLLGMAGAGPTALLWFFWAAFSAGKKGWELEFLATLGNRADEVQTKVSSSIQEARTHDSLCGRKIMETLQNTFPSACPHSLWSREELLGWTARSVLTGRKSGLHHPPWAKGHPGPPWRQPGQAHPPSGN